MLTRRRLLAGSAATAVLAACARSSERRYEAPGRLLGAPAGLGHRLRDAALPAPTATRRVRVAIAGAGISALAVAYALRKAGIDDVLLVDAQESVGGNSAWGRNDISAYPWGAHYVPLVPQDCAPVIDLFTTLGIIVDRDDRGRPVYDEYCLSADPQERLWIHGRWQDGIVPTVGATRRDQQQYASFFGFVEGLKGIRGRDGRRLFALPVDESSADEEWRSLDGIDFRSYALKMGWDSRLLHWYLDYCCRDDYGCPSAATSAWAGLHYFAARSGVAANASAGTVVTWPEGNGFLARELAQRSGAMLETRCLATSARALPGGAMLDYFDERTERSVRVLADAIVLCVPRFIAARLTGAPAASAAAFSYAPWMVGNISLERLPGGRGQPLSWDNVVYGSPSLGYVDATHQGLEQARQRTVLTYYWPLSHADPAVARAEALRRSCGDWQRLMLQELYQVHPELEGHVTNVDAWVWGHAMIRPVPGFLWGPDRQAALRQHPPVFHAHSDMSGISIFEEAYCRGQQVAGGVQKYLATLRSASVGGPRA